MTLHDEVLAGHLTEREALLAAFRLRIAQLKASPEPDDCLYFLERVAEAIEAVPEVAARTR